MALSGESFAAARGEKNLARSVESCCGWSTAPQLSSPSSPFTWSVALILRFPPRGDVVENLVAVLVTFVALMWTLKALTRGAQR